VFVLITIAIFVLQKINFALFMVDNSVTDLTFQAGHLTYSY